MIILRTKLYAKKSPMLERIIEKLDKEGIEDYDISSRIPKEDVSITTDLANLKIYLPLEHEYDQYEIDNFIREKFGSFIRTTTKQDMDVYVMTLSTRLTEDQYYKLVKEIIEISEFIVLLSE